MRPLYLWLLNLPMPPAHWKKTIQRSVLNLLMVPEHWKKTMCKDQYSTCQRCQHTGRRPCKDQYSTCLWCQHTGRRPCKDQYSTCQCCKHTGRRPYKDQYVEHSRWIYTMTAGDMQYSAVNTADLLYSQHHTNMDNYSTLNAAAHSDGLCAPVKFLFLSWQSTGTLIWNIWDCGIAI